MKLQRQIGEHTVIVECGDDLSAQGEALLNKMVELNGRGPALRDGTVIEFGWAPIKLRAGADGLIACEPDFDGDALANYVPGVDRLLRVLSSQVALLRAIGVEPMAARFNEKLVAKKNCWQLVRLYLEREPTTRAGDSGWYVGDENHPAAREQPGELEAVYIYQLLKLRPGLMKVLALPPGYLIFMDEDEPESIFDPEGRDLWAV